MNPAPSAVKPMLGRAGKAKVKGNKVKFSTKVTLPIPSGFAATTACTGKLKGAIKISGVKKAVSASHSLAPTALSCSATLGFSLPKSKKGKKVKIKLTFPGNTAILPFSRTLSFKIA